MLEDERTRLRAACQRAWQQTQVALEHILVVRTEASWLAYYDAMIAAHEASAALHGMTVARQRSLDAWRAHRNALYNQHRQLEDFPEMELVEAGHE